MNVAVNGFGDMSVSKVLVAMQLGEVVNIELVIGNLFDQRTIDPRPSEENVMRRQGRIGT